MSFLEADDGARLRYADRGTGPSTFLLVHGWKGSHRVWDQTIARLEGSHRVVAYDQRGMGESEKPSRPFGFDRLAEDLASVIKGLELEDVTLVGLSMGCSTSLSYMERDGSRVARLALVNGPLRLTRTDDFPHTMTEAELDGYIDELAAGWPASERDFQAASVRGEHPALVEFLYGIALQTPLPIMLDLVRAQKQLDMRPVLERLELPVLAVYSRHDPYYPAELADYIAERCPQGDRVIVEKGGHNAQLEAPGPFVEVLERFASGEPQR